MWILSFFTNSGNPALGLSPTVRIRTVPGGSLIVNDAAMSENGDGFYCYNFTTYSGTEEYTIRCDGGATLSGTDRYTYGSNESFIEDIADAVWDEPQNEHTFAGSFGAQIIDLAKQNRQYNISLEEVRATSNILSRKVATGEVSHIIYRIKDDADSDWTGATVSGTVYMWYRTLGDTAPYKVGASS